MSHHAVARQQCFSKHFDEHGAFECRLKRRTSSSLAHLASSPPVPTASALAIRARFCILRRRARVWRRRRCCRAAPANRRIARLNHPTPHAGHFDPHLRQRPADHAPSRRVYRAGGRNRRPNRHRSGGSLRDSVSGALQLSGTKPVRGGAACLPAPMARPMAAPVPMTPIAKFCLVGLHVLGKPTRLFGPEASRIGRIRLAVGEGRHRGVRGSGRRAGSLRAPTNQQPGCVVMTMNNPRLSS